MSAEAWFGNLNSAMQRRVVEVIDSDDEMTHILLWYPLPFRQGHQWVYPIRGEVPDGQWTATDLAEIRAYVASGPKLKRASARTLWTDLTLEDNASRKG